MEIQLGIIFELVNTGPIKLTRKFGSIEVNIDPLGDDIKFTMDTEFDYTGEKEIWARSLLRPSATIVTSASESDTDTVPEKGHQAGFVVKYDTTTRVIVAGGSYEVDGAIYSLAADTTYTLLSLIPEAGFRYIYLDKSASTSTVPFFYDEVTESVPNIAKNGEYHPTTTEDRLVGVIYSPSGSATIDFFETRLNGSYIRNTSAIKLLAANFNPTGDWQTTTTESDVFVPVNAKEILLMLNGSDALASMDVSWGSKELAAVVAWNNVENFHSTYNNAFFPSWGALGVSRQVRIAGNDNDDNNLDAWVGGYGYTR